MKMNKFESQSGFLPWFIALLLVALTAGCGGGQDPILGAGGLAVGAIPGAPAGAIIPGATCTAAAGPTIPTVTSSNPTNGNQFVTTSTSGVAGSGKLITATFSLAMNAATINATTFTLAPVGGVVLVPASVSYNAATRVATLTTASALLPNTSYTAIITAGAMTTPGGIPLACAYAWNFKTGAAATGLAPVNMGLAAPFGISATAGMATAGGISTVNGNVLLDPGAFCNGAPQPVDGAGGIGPCLAFRPIINGTVISSLFDPGANLATIKADLNAAFLSLTPPAGPPAAGSLGGGTVLPAPTTLGAVAGSALVQGDNYFVPGVYTDTGSSILVTGDLTLDAQGNPDAVFVFQSFSTVGTTGAAVCAGPHDRILLINGAKASNVWWVAASSATVGTCTEWQGNILAAVSITLNAGATSCGRMMAGAWVGGGGAITLGNTTAGVVVSVPGNVNAPASCQ